MGWKKVYDIIWMICAQALQKGMNSAFFFALFSVDIIIAQCYIFLFHIAFGENLFNSIIEGQCKAFKADCGTQSFKTARVCYFEDMQLCLLLFRELTLESACVHF